MVGWNLTKMLKNRSTTCLRAYLKHQIVLLLIMIETSFRHLKSNGIKLEEIKPEGERRSRMMMAVVVFVYTLSVCEGLTEYRKVDMNSFKNGGVTGAYSVFSVDLDILTSICHSMEVFLVISLKI